MRPLGLFLVLLSLPFIGFTIYWFSKAATLSDEVETNLRRVQEQLAVNGDGMRISYDDLEVVGYPFSTFVRIVSPVVERSSAERTQRLAMDYIELRPQSHGIELLRLELPNSVTATDTYKGHSFVYTVTPTTPPEVLVRTPAYEKRLPRGRSLFGDVRVTPDAELAKLPENILHQRAVLLPPRFTLTIQYEGNTYTRSYNLPKPAAKQWKRLNYRLAGQVDAFFNILTLAVHHPTPSAVQKKPQATQKKVNIQDAIKRHNR